MSKDCLVTKLKAESSNESLKYIGAIEIERITVGSYSGNDSGFTLKFNQSGTQDEVYVESDDFTKITTNSGVEQNLPWYPAPGTNGERIIYFGSAKGKIRICNKYANRIVGIYGMDANKGYTTNATIEDFVYRFDPSVVTTLDLHTTPISGDIGCLKNLTALTTINISKTNVTGDISVFGLLTGLTSINSANTTIYGDIASLGPLTSLTYYNCIGNGLHGAVEEFVAAQITNGRSSVAIGSPITISNLLYYCTFGGNTYDSATYLLSWESATKISARYSIGGNVTKVYTKGYSQSEAEAAFPGITIIRVDA